MASLADSGSDPVFLLLDQHLAEVNGSKRHVRLYEFWQAAKAAIDESFDFHALARHVAACDRYRLVKLDDLTPLLVRSAAG